MRCELKWRYVLCCSDLWDLSLCQTLLPVIGELIGNRHEKWVLNAVNAACYIITGLPMNRHCLFSNVDVCPSQIANPTVRMFPFNLLTPS
jgi:hypothetical protein